jgi:RNA polymerase sigma-70 factor (ECF subfamily)
MSEPTTSSDSDLLQRVSAGDEEAFAALYRRRQGGIYRFALQMSGSPAIAEEVTQEVFLTLIRNARQYDPSRGSLSAYLYGVARNQVLKLCARNGSPVPLDDGAAEGLASTDDPLGAVARQETVQAVRRAVLSLPVAYREVVVLCDLHEVSYAEAAEALGCAVGTVRSRLHRGRALLVEKLARCSV